MECSHWKTPTPIKNGFNYNMQNCSDWPTQTPTQMQMGRKSKAESEQEFDARWKIARPVPLIRGLIQGIDIGDLVSVVICT